MNKIKLTVPSLIKKKFQLGWLGCCNCDLVVLGLSPWSASCQLGFSSTSCQFEYLSPYFKVHMATRWTIRHSLMLFWFKIFNEWNQEVTIHRPNILTLLSSTFIKGDLNAVTRGPFIHSLISCPFLWRGVNRCLEVSHHHHD